MITSERINDTLVFFCTTEKEWEDATSKGQVVFLSREMELLKDHPELGPDVREVILRAKKTVPTFCIMGIIRRDDDRRAPAPD